MPGIKALRKLQFGRETTPGTAVAATTLWRGMGVLDDQREVVFPEEDIGYISGVNRSYIPKYAAALDITSVEATFEQLPHLLEMGIATVSPTTDGSGRVRTYTFPTTSDPAIKTYTIEGGDNQQAEEMEYCFAEEITLEGSAGEAWKMGGKVIGRQVTASTFTSGITVPVVEEILFQKSKLFIDAVSDTPGTTQVSNTLLDASLSIKTGLVAKYTADGQLYFSFINRAQMFEATLKLTFEHNASATTEKDNWRNQVPRYIRLLVEGSNLATAGTTYQKKTLIVDLPGRWSKFNPLGDKDGNDIVDAEFRVAYDPTAATAGKIIVVNEVAAL